MKRAIDTTLQEEVSHAFIKRCRTEFNNNPKNILERNAVVNSGSLWSITNSNIKNKISHIFLNTIKKKDTKATNQGSSGRCWMFSGLNCFRHNVIEAMGVNNFEFSETYLFFWDKYERCNSFLQFFIENKEQPNARIVDYFLNHYMDDGGFWNTFTNLVEKYGVVPKDAMPETATSDWSSDINDTLLLRLKATASHLYRIRNKTYEERLKVKEETMKRIYNILVKYLGEPPESFTWHFNRECEFNEDEPNAIENLTPQKFRDMTIPIDTRKFVVLSNMPSHAYYKLYEVKNTDNVIGGQRLQVLNVPIKVLKKYAMKSLLKKVPVWFAGDVTKGFHPIEAVLCDKMVNDEILFGRLGTTFTKTQQTEFQSLQGNHAMTLTGVNIDDNNNPVSWQVENSWGFYDYEVPGEDGFLFMSDSWFDNCLVQCSIHYNFLTPSLQKKFNQEPIILEAYDALAPALRATPHSRPSNYLGMDKKSKK